MGSLLVSDDQLRFEPILATTYIEEFQVDREYCYFVIRQRHNAVNGLFPATAYGFAEEDTARHHKILVYEEVCSLGFLADTYANYG